MSIHDDKHRLFIDKYFANGFNRYKAYAEIYPDCQEKYLNMSAYKIMQKPKVKEYYKEKYLEFQESINIDKRIMIDKLVNQIDTFDMMIYLAAKDKLTDDEADKLARLSELIKGSDIMKAKDMICKLIGAYEAEKIEIKDRTFRVGFDLDNES